MFKKVLILGSQRKKSREIIDFFKDNSDKYKVTALLCNDEKQIDYFKKQIKEMSPSVVFFPNKELAEKIEEEFNIKCYFDYLQYSLFLKNTDSDLVISDFTGIDSVKLILATIGEYKDIGLLNLEPILYSGKIIINEAKNKGVNLKLITSQFHNFSQFLETRSLSDINKVTLIDYDTKEDKENLMNYTYPSKTISEFKKIMYYKNKMWLSRHLIGTCNLYDLDVGDFQYYKSNTDKVNLILQLKDGSNFFNYFKNTKDIIYNHYYLENKNIKEIDSLENKIDIKLQKIKEEEIRTLELAKSAIKKGGSYPILFQIVYDICAEGIYNNNLPQDSFVKIFSKIIEDDSLYSKNPNIQTIFALEEKIRLKIESEYYKKKTKK